MEPFENYYNMKGMPSPAKEYIEYYSNNPDSCCGLVYVNGKYSTVHASGRTKRVKWFWNLLPMRYIGFNKKGICFVLRGAKNVQSKK